MQDEMRVAEAIAHPSLQQQKVQTMTFSDASTAEMSYVVKSGSDLTRTDRYSEDVSLSDFLSRPIKIATRNWAVGTNEHWQINPWELFFQNPRIINRVNNYNIMRLDLHIKIVINGNGFYYGRAIASYNPMHLDDDLSRNRALIPQDIIQASQQPHVYLNPTTSEGGTIVAPFFYPYDFASLPRGNWDELGQLTIRSINELLHANGGTEPVRLSVFAWAENVEMMVPTSEPAFDLVPQSDIDEVDQANTEGIVSGPATSLAAMANMLGKNPTFAPYARPTEIGAKMVAGLAKLLGYSRPNTTKVPEPYMPVPTGSLANTTVPDLAFKLSVDDKQALGMGQEISGISGDDPLSILNIAQRESYLTTFLWRTTSVADDLLFNMRVTPMLHDRSNGDTQYHLPALAAAALPFEYWTGSINVRFQVVASAFHKGRLRVVYDPEHLQATPEFNVNYQEVVDLADKQDFTMCIKNSTQFGFLDIQAIDDVAPAALFSTSRITAATNYSNGVLGVYVVNDLVTPNNTTPYDVEVNVFVSAGPDFRVMSPATDHMDSIVFAPESDIAPVQTSDVPSNNAPLGTDPMDINHMSYTPDPISAVYGGEVIGSFRQLLKRYYRHSAFAVPNVSGNRLAKSRRCMFPYHRGGVDGAQNVSVSGAYNYCNTTLLNYITTAFSGWRGSIRVKVVPFAFGTAQSEHAKTYVYRDVGTYEESSVANPVGTLDEVTYDLIAGARADGGTWASGAALVSLDINDILTFEVPYQQRRRFAPAKNENWTTGSFGLANGFTVWSAANYNANSFSEMSFAAGEDFQVYFWTGMPPFTFERTPPVPL